MVAICEEFEHYSWRRVRAALRQQGLIVNHKKIRRLMREHDLQPRTRAAPSRRRTAITISRSSPISPPRSSRMGPTSSGWQTSPVIGGFVYVVDAWSRRVVGYAISRSIDARLTLAALRVAIERRKPPPGCLHHSDRGSQYAAGGYRQFLAANGFVGSMGRRGNPYDNAKAESFMKTLNVEGVYPMAFETFAGVVEHLPRFIDDDLQCRRLHSAPGYLSPAHLEDQHARLMVTEAT